MRERITTILAAIAYGLVIIWLLPVLVIILVGAGVFWLVRIPARKRDQKDRIEAVQKLYSQGVRMYLQYDRNHAFSVWLEETFIPDNKKIIIARKYSNDDIELIKEVEELLESATSHAQHGTDELYDEFESGNDEDTQSALLFVLCEDGSMTCWSPPIGVDGEIDSDNTKLLFIRVAKNAITKMDLVDDDPKINFFAAFKSEWGKEADRWYNPDPEAGLYRRATIYVNRRPILAWTRNIIILIIGGALLYRSFGAEPFAWQLILAALGVIAIIDAVGSTAERLSRRKKERHDK